MGNIEKLVLALLAVPLGVALAIGLSALFALPVQYLWNHVAVHAVDGLHPLTFLHAWGLNILTSFLFKSSK